DLVDGATAEQGMDVIRKTEEQFVFRDDDNCKIRTLSPLNLEKDVEFYEVTLHPQGRLESAAHFQGTREFLTVQSGSIEVQSGEVSVVLKKGDSVQYAADVDHSINNIGKRDAVIFLVDIYSSSH
ncbi:MAG: cupin domain-containing protein, partial [Mariniblastus sp.]|nr:cupin domain-containing protein [Mariniblastus sp.]